MASIYQNKKCLLRLFCNRMKYHFKFGCIALSSFEKKKNVFFIVVIFNQVYGFVDVAFCMFPSLEMSYDQKSVHHRWQRLFQKLDDKLRIGRHSNGIKFNIRSDHHNNHRTICIAERKRKSCNFTYLTSLQLHIYLFFFFLFIIQRN